MSKALARASEIDMKSHRFLKMILIYMFLKPLSSDSALYIRSSARTSSARTHTVTA